MKIKKVSTVFFSPAGNTEKIVMAVTEGAAAALGAETVNVTDITRPEHRAHDLIFGNEELVIVAVPTYAGRVPNKIMPYICAHLKGEGALCAAVVTYGNRSFDDSLMELTLLMQENGFTVTGGGAFACQHAFADRLAAGRPDETDLAEARRFGQQLAKKISEGNTETPAFPGHNPVGPYYVPKGTDGQPAKFLKAKPVTDRTLCTECGVCAEKCPMGSIHEADRFEVTGICIKCQACILSCPTGAKKMIDEAFLSHKQMLEENFADRRAENVRIV